jgi:protein SCO1
VNVLKIFSVLILSSAFAWGHPKDASGLTATEKPKEFQGIGITEQLGQRLDLNLMVNDESGEKVPLSKFFNAQKPVLFSLVYYSCPGLCNFHLNGVTDVLKTLDWSVGQKFEVIALSFDPREDAALATKKKISYLKVYDRPGTEAGWHFLTADEATIKKIAASVGFQYRWEESTKEWAHASAATVLTPDGKISRYLHGILFDKRDVKMALMEAVDGKIGSITEKLVWFCYKYDQHASKYSVAISRLMKVAGALCVLLLGAVLVSFWARARREQAKLRL